MFRIGSTNLINRNDWLKKTLAKIPAGAKILDAGAGELKYKPLCEHLKYYSQDVGSYNGQGDGKGLQTKTWDQTKLDFVCDIAKIPAATETFDAIMCIEVFEHIANPIEAMKEFSRLLKKDGYLIITAPMCSWRHFSPYYYYSGFSDNFYEKYLKEFGFNIIEITSNGDYFEFLAQELKRIPHVVEKYLIKNKVIFYITKILTIPLLLFLTILIKIKKTNKSNELLVYGFHVLAKKI